MELLNADECKRFVAAAISDVTKYIEVANTIQNPPVAATPVVVKVKTKQFSLLNLSNGVTLKILGKKFTERLQNPAYAAAASAAGWPVPDRFLPQANDDDEIFLDFNQQGRIDMASLTPDQQRLVESARTFVLSQAA